MLEAGWAAAESAFGPACAAHPRRHVVARRGRGKTGWQHGRLIGQDAMVPWWAVARWSWCGRVRDAGTMRGRWRGSVVAERGLHAVLTGRRVALSAGPYWFLAPNGSSAQDDKYIGAGARRGAGLRDPAYDQPNLSNLVGDGGAREASRPQPLPSELHKAPSICTRDDGVPAGCLAPRLTAPLPYGPLTQDKRPVGLPHPSHLGRDRSC